MFQRKRILNKNTNPFERFIDERLKYVFKNININWFTHGFKMIEIEGDSIAKYKHNLYWYDLCIDYHIFLIGYNILFLI